MMENESLWFSKWEEELPSPEELTPLSQTLITPHLAFVFDLLDTKNVTNSHSTLPATHPSSSGFEKSGDLVSGAGVDEPARTLKRPRLVWTLQLHKRFVDAVAHLGIKNAVPKTIMQLMSVDGLTRENVASHLQKYRLYLKRIRGHSNGGISGGLRSFDPANSPVPPHWMTHTQLQQQFHQQRQMEQFGSPASNDQIEPHRMAVPPYEDDVATRAANGGRMVLPLFPTVKN